MTHVIELARRAARLRAIPLVALATLFGACNATENLTSTSEVSDTPADVPAAAEPTDGALSATFRGGIPIGYYGMPTSVYGAVYNGAMRNIWPSYLVRELAAIKNRGGKIIVNLAGHAKYYTVDGHFSLTKWKQQVARFRGVNFSSYVKDGTLVANYLIDEPNDSRNWGKPISGSTLEEMARYSKSLYPSLPTVVRAEASYLASFSTSYRYLDGAWAQYVTRKGSASDFIKRNVADAQRKGLSLVTGLNVTRGGPNGGQMSASLVKSAGSALLNSSYPCAFISWDYKSSYTSGAIGDAMKYLSSKAKARSTKSCRSS